MNSLMITLWSIFCGQTHSSLVFCIFLLKLPFAQQGMDFTVSKHLDLLICKCALHPVGVVPEVLVWGLVIFFEERGLVLTREVLVLEGLEVFLDEKSS